MKTRELTHNTGPFPVDFPKVPIDSDYVNSLNANLKNGFFNTPAIQEMGRRLFELKFEGPKRIEWVDENKRIIERVK